MYRESEYRGMEVREKSMRWEDPEQARGKGPDQGHRQRGCGKNRGDICSLETGEKDGCSSVDKVALKWAKRNNKEAIRDLYHELVSS